MTAYIQAELADFGVMIEGALAAVEDAEPAALAHILALIRDLRADLQVIYREVERQLLDAMGDTKRFVVPGLGEIERKRGTSRTAWDSDGLRPVVVARALDERQLDEESGEYESQASAVSRVLGECARFEWRVTALRAHGIDPDEYCHTAWGDSSIALPPRAHP